MKRPCILSLLLLLSLAIPVRAATTVALVSDSTSRDTLSLLQSQVPPSTTLQFVNPTVLDKILTEQEFSVLADPDHALALGRLVHADLFAILESSPDPKNPTPLGLVVFDASTGIRLADATLPPTSPDTLASTVTDILLAANKKRTAVPAARRT